MQPNQDDELYRFFIVITAIDLNTSNDYVILFAYKCDASNITIQPFYTDKIYFTNTIDTIVTESIVKNMPINIECVKTDIISKSKKKTQNTRNIRNTRNTRNTRRIRYAQWKITKIEYQSQWIEIDTQSKLF